jgi:hypothetical protein
MNDDDAPPPEGRSDNRPVARPKLVHGKRMVKGACGAWHTQRSVLFEMNELHVDFRQVLFEHFRALLESNDEAFVCRLADYVRWILSMYMFVRVERPRGSKHFVLGYVKCDWVFSFAPRFEQMRLRLSRVPPVVLTKVEHGENKVLRLACVGETNYERAVARYRNVNGKPPLIAALEAKDEESAMALMDGGDDPNVDRCGNNALHSAAEEGCRQPLLNRILGMIHDVNAGRYPALMLAVMNNHLDVVISLMNHPGIDLNVRGSYNSGFTALHYAASGNHPAILAQLLGDDRIDCSLKSNEGITSLELAIALNHQECVKLLREHGSGM